MCASVAAGAGLSLASPAQAAATTYYVNSVSGNDAAAGTGPATAWKTLSKVNSTTFAAGDTVLFARGRSWAGQLAPKGSGSATAPITISAYGTGALPRFDGHSLAGGAVVSLQNQSYWTIQNLDIVSDSGADNFGSLTVDGVARAGIQVRNTVANSTVRGIVIRSNTVHDVNGCFHCTGIDAHVNGGIVADTTQLGANFDGLTVENNRVQQVGRTGIVVWDASYFTTDQLVVVQSALSTRVVVRGNTVIDPDSDGILAFGTDGALLESNVVRGAGQRTIVGSTMAASAGLWPTRAMNTIVQFNEVSGTRLHGTDGQGFDVDLGSSNTRVQYNYSHDNEGGFLLLMGGYSNSTVARYNLSVNDGWGGQKGVITFSYGVPAPVRIYHNTIVIPSGSPANPIHCDGDAGACAPTTPGTWYFVNNIVANHGTGQYTFPGLGTNAIFSGNLFSGNHPASEPADPQKITTDPHFVNPNATGNGFAVAQGFRLAAGSPAISTGQVVPANGLRDLFGNWLPTASAPSRGMHEAAPSAAPAPLVDLADDWLVSTGHPANATIDTSGPLSNFDGDPSRFSRSDAAAGWLRWAAFAGDAVTVRTYLFAQQPTALTVVAVDATGGTTTVATSASAAVATTNGWVRRTITSAALPAGTVAVELRTAAVQSWAVQIGTVTID
ncbi:MULTISPECIES: right-handed parallel beta-helix repeat-containing protein [unclassified Micromonospora]|uniref:right-handed parallel beta-helix repeat-containing protein n=1 Tax=unclassified Micromonospora TaxID=2617518 RepID=UPI003645C3EC